MRSRITRGAERLTYANVTATLALFVALGGGAYAASTAKKNSVVSKSIKNGEVKEKDLGDGAVTHEKLGNVEFDEIATSESTSSSASTDLATPGPIVNFSLDEPSIVEIGGHVEARSASEQPNFCSIVALVDGGPKTVGLGATNSQVFTTLSNAGSIVLGPGDHEIKMRYSASAGLPCHFRERKLLVEVGAPGS